jgi:hypothetical protein
LRRSGFGLSRWREARAEREQAKFWSEATTARELRLADLTNDVAKVRRAMTADHVAKYGTTAREVLLRQSKTEPPKVTYMVGVRLHPSAGTARVHEVIFFGEPVEQVMLAIKALIDSFKQLFNESASTIFSYNMAIDELLRKLSKDYFPDKVFRLQTLGIRELVSYDRNSQNRVSAVKLALVSGAPLEFGYGDHRGSGAKYPTFRAQRVNVLSMDEEGFLAKHKRGIRRYSYHKMQWAITEGSEPYEVQHEMKLIITPVAVQGGMLTWNFELDRVRSRGEQE